MYLDLRWPLGAVFVIYGLILVVYGVVSEPQMYQRSLGINVNLWWGLVLLVFGGFALVMAYRARRRVP